jgi:hypothetical protein
MLTDNRVNPLLHDSIFRLWKLRLAHYNAIVPTFSNPYYGPLAGREHKNPIRPKSLFQKKYPTPEALFLQCVKEVLENSLGMSDDLIKRITSSTPNYSGI